MEYRRSLMGYAPSSVRSWFSSVGGRHGARILERETVLADLRAQNAALAAQIAGFEKDLATGSAAPEPDLSGEVWRVLREAMAGSEQSIRQAAATRDARAREPEGLRTLASTLEQRIGRIREECRAILAFAADPVGVPEAVCAAGEPEAAAATDSTGEAK